MIRISFFLIMLLSFFSCTSYTPRDVNKKYIKLSKEFDKLIDNVIVEKNRANLEKSFYDFTLGIEGYKKDNENKDTEYLDKYLEDSKIKLQYLKDLKD